MSAPEGESAAPDAPADNTTDLFGFAAALGAYGIWGLAVLFFKLLEAVPATEIIAPRTPGAVVFAALWLLARGRRGGVRPAVADPAVIFRLLASAVLIAGNWLIFVWAVSQARVLEVSFGYFINPLVNVALGFVLLGERFSRLQGIAIAVAALAVAVQATGLTGFPWVSLALAFSFAFYGFLRKTVAVKPTPGLFADPPVRLPQAPPVLGGLDVSGTGHFLADPGRTVLLVLTGIITALPLVLFATGARRLPLSTVGILQYLAPSLHFLLAVFAFGEPLSPTRLVSFAIIWLSLAIFAADLLVRRRALRPQG